MPLLDAAIAFALTMLGLSSLVGMVQEWLHQARKVRSRHLEIMLQRLLTECLTTELATSDKTDSTESRDGEIHDGRRLGLDQLLDEVRSGRLERISTRRLLRELQGSRQILDAAKERALAAAWERLGKEQTEVFRARAKTSATVVALALAFGLNIDSLHLLEGYMSRGLSHDLVTEAAPKITDTGPGRDLVPFELDVLPIGWSRFPSCPATSTDPRCRSYWARAAGAAGVESLSYEQRRALDPLRHPRAALGLFSNAYIPSSTAVHMATDGGPPEDGGARLLPQIPSAMLGNLPWWPVTAWILGCLLTAVLAGQGSPFWIEVVRRLALTRDNLRQARLDAQGVDDTAEDQGLDDTAEDQGKPGTAGEQGKQGAAGVLGEAGDPPIPSRAP